MTLTTGLRYDPNATYEVTHRDVAYRKIGDRELMVRIYQPQGSGPFPALLGLHGGAWEGKEWLQNEDSHLLLARSGIVVFAIQFRTSLDAPHPTAQQDINYATRWLKAHASEYNASADLVGAIGWSSGGHQVMLAGMFPKLYASDALADAPNVSGSLAYVIIGWPVIDPPGRYELAKRLGKLDVAAKHLNYFVDEAGQEAGSPPHMLRAGVVPEETPPSLLLQGAADEGVPRMCAEEWVELYSIAGGVIELGKYPGEPHGFMRNLGPNRTRAFNLTKSFIQRQLDEQQGGLD